MLWGNRGRERGTVSGLTHTHTHTCGEIQTYAIYRECRWVHSSSGGERQVGTCTDRQTWLATEERHVVCRLQTVLESFALFADWIISIQPSHLPLLKTAKLQNQQNLKSTMCLSVLWVVCCWCLVCVAVFRLEENWVWTFSTLRFTHKKNVGGACPGQKCSQQQEVDMHAEGTAMTDRMLQKPHVFVYIDTSVGPYPQKLSNLVVFPSLHLSSTCLVPLFNLELFVLYSFFSSFASVTDTPNSLGLTSMGYFLFYSHMGSDILPGGREETLRNSWLLWKISVKCPEFSLCQWAICVTTAVHGR